MLRLAVARNGLVRRSAAPVCANMVLVAMEETVPRGFPDSSQVEEEGNMHGYIRWVPWQTNATLVDERSEISPLVRNTARWSTARDRERRGVKFHFPTNIHRSIEFTRASVHCVRNRVPVY